MDIAEAFYSTAFRLQARLDAICDRFEGHLGMGDAVSSVRAFTASGRFSEAVSGCDAFPASTDAQACLWAILKQLQRLALILEPSDLPDAGMQWEAMDGAGA